LLLKFAGLQSQLFYCIIIEIKDFSIFFKKGNKAVAGKFTSIALIFIGAWGVIILIAMLAFFSYFVFAGKSFVSRQSFIIAASSIIAVLFVAGNNFFLAAINAIIIAGILSGLIVLVWRANQEKIMPKIKLIVTLASGFFTAGMFCCSFGALIWPLITGSRGKSGCFDLFCLFLILMSGAFAIILFLWYKRYFLPVWRNGSRSITGI